MSWKQEIIFPLHILTLSPYVFQSKYNQNFKNVKKCHLVDPLNPLCLSLCLVVVGCGCVAILSLSCQLGDQPLLLLPTLILRDAHLEGGGTLTLLDYAHASRGQGEVNPILDKAHLGRGTITLLDYAHLEGKEKLTFLEGPSRGQGKVSPS